MDAKAHWENVYESKPPSQVCWYQPHSLLSLELIRATRIPPDGPIIDVGGGASTLVDDLLDEDYQDVSVLEISANALRVTRERLGARAALVKWMEADVTDSELPRQHFAVWHDRAVFHATYQRRHNPRYARHRKSCRDGFAVRISRKAGLKHMLRGEPREGTNRPGCLQMSKLASTWDFGKVIYQE